MDFDRIAALPIFSNSLLEWGLACGALLAIFFPLLLLRRFVRRASARMQTTQKVELMEVPLEILSRTTTPFLLLVSIFVGLSLLTMSPRTARLLNSVTTIALFWQAGVWMGAAVTAWLGRKQRQGEASDRASVSSLAVIGFIAQVAIWAMVLLLTLDNLGVDITALVAGLGIGGIAVALAVQNVLGDLLASLSITLDKPFVLGDFLILEDYLGSVEHIGIKSTRLRSLSGEQIILSNADLLKSRVRNYGRMQQRRIVFTIGITYETAPDLIERLPALIREIVESEQHTRFDRSHFAKYGAASLDFETVYYVQSADYNQYMDIQQAINLKLFRRLAELSIEFAYPTQKLYVVPQGVMAFRREDDGSSSRSDGTGNPSEPSATKGELHNA